MFQQTERLQASEITQKKGICFTFLVQTSHMFRQTKRWLQMTNAGSTNNHEGIGWDLGTYQVHFIKEMEEPRQVSQLEKCMFYPCSFHQKVMFSHPKLISTNHDRPRSGVDQNQNDKSSAPGCWRRSVFGSRPGKFGSSQLH